MMQRNPQSIWYDAWFNSPYYDILYDNHTEQEAASFVEALVKQNILPPKATILDLACGSGRFSHPLYKKGFAVTGLDIARHSIANAKTKYKNTGMNFMVHNMLDPFPINSFDVICNFYTSFGYFNQKSMLHVLQNIFNALNPKGGLLIDYMNASKIKKTIVAEEKITKQKIDFHITRKVSGEYITKTIKLYHQGEEKVFQENVYDLDLEGFKSLLQKRNFQLLKTYGDYMMQPFNEQTSNRLILYARKHT